jgi:hypothetical protein
MTKSNVRQLRPRNLAHVTRDRGYRWTDRDPVLDEITRLITDSGLGVGDLIERVLDASNNQVHLSYSTISNWLNGQTRRPQNFTVTWVAAALGYRREFVKI